MEYTYPCEICIVQSCCISYCAETYKFINKMICADYLSKQQEEEYESTTPTAIKNKIDEMKGKQQMYAFPDNWEPKDPKFILRTGIR